MRSVFITGICGGIGQAIAKRLQKEGWAVYGSDIVDLPKDLAVAGFWKGDVAKEVFWSSTVMSGLEKLESLEGFVHNAAIQPCLSITETSLEDWNETLAVNLTAAFLGARYLSPLLKMSKSAIVNVSSVHAIATSPGMSAYVASKGGLLAFTRAAALEFAQYGIRVNAVLPGAVSTGMLETGLKRDVSGADFARERLVRQTPLKRIGSADEVAKVISFLLDDDQSSFITGQSVTVDGGALARLPTE